jgi:hypothetical protein
MPLHPFHERSATFLQKATADIHRPPLVSWMDSTAIEISAMSARQ